MVIGSHWQVGPDPHRDRVERWLAVDDSVRSPFAM
jgi:hypothetical protein